jgi:hypothetical protein
MSRRKTPPGYFQEPEAAPGGRAGTGNPDGGHSGLVDYSAVEVASPSRRMLWRLLAATCV